MFVRHSLAALALVLTLGACAHRSDVARIPDSESVFRTAQLPEEFHGAAIGGDALRGELGE